MNNHYDYATPGYDLLQGETWFTPASATPKGNGKFATLSSAPVLAAFSGNSTSTITLHFEASTVLNNKFTQGNVVGEAGLVGPDTVPTMSLSGVQLKYYYQ